MGDVEAGEGRRWVGRIARSCGLTFRGHQGGAGAAGSAHRARPLRTPAAGSPRPGRSRPRPGLGGPRPTTAGRPVGAGRGRREGAARGQRGRAGSAAGSPHRARAAAFLSFSRRCREPSSCPWRAWGPRTPRAATRWCARCATHSSSARACWTASTTFVPAACGAAPPTAASPARCASECPKAQWSPPTPRGDWPRLDAGLGAGRAGL